LFSFSHSDNSKTNTVKKTILLFAFGTWLSISFAQTITKDKGTFKTYEPGYFQNSILKGIEDFESQKETPKNTKSFKADASTFNIPATKELSGTISRYRKVIRIPAGLFQPLRTLNPKFIVPQAKK
jgi:hypothetical protein